MEVDQNGLQSQQVSELDEYPIFDRFLRIKQKVMVLKNERIAPQQILPLEHEMEDTIITLMEIRGGTLYTNGHVNNRTDEELNKVCQLMSLCFMTIGKWHKSPAIFCQATAIKNCFYQLEQIGIYDQKTLNPYGSKLEQLELFLADDEQKSTLTEPILELVRYNHKICRRIFDQLLSTLREMSPTLFPIRDELLKIRSELVSIAFQERFDEQQILHVQERLREIDSARGKNGLFLKDESPEDDSLALIGQGTLTDILEHTFDACHALLNIDSTPIIDSVRLRLIEIKSDLEGIEITRKWSLRQTNLFTYQQQLHDVTRMLHEEKEFQGEEGYSLLSYLSAGCYNIILNLLGVGPSVAEPLLPIYHQLTTLRDCLKRLQLLDCSLSEEEKMLYALKCRSIDMMRIDGKFYDEHGLIPEGQSKCVHALEECYALIQELSKEEE